MVRFAPGQSLHRIRDTGKRLNHGQARNRIAQPGYQKGQRQAVDQRAVAHARHRRLDFPQVRLGDDRPAGAEKVHRREGRELLGFLAGFVGFSADHNTGFAFERRLHGPRIHPAFEDRRAGGEAGICAYQQILPGDECLARLTHPRGDVHYPVDPAHRHLEDQHAKPFAPLAVKRHGDKSGGAAPAGR